MKTYNNQIIETIKNRIVEHFDPVKIILFGSYAYGEPKEDSDIDLLIIGETKFPHHKQISEMLTILSDIKVGVDPIVYTPEEVEEWKNVPQAFVTSIVNKGKVIYEK